MPFALLQVAESQLGELMATNSAGQQEGKQRPITFALQPLAVWCLPECVPLFGGQPVAEPDTQLLYALDAPYPRRRPRPRNRRRRSARRRTGWRRRPVPSTGPRSYGTPDHLVFVGRRCGCHLPISLQDHSSLRSAARAREFCVLLPRGADQRARLSGAFPTLVDPGRNPRSEVFLMLMSDRKSVV